MSERLIVRREGRVARITLRRPEARNALDLVLCAGLLSAIGEANADATVGAILLDAVGSAFCAGMDLKEPAALDPGSLAPLHVGLFSFGRDLTKPMVAAVQGPALGGGTGLALNALLCSCTWQDARSRLRVKVGMSPTQWPKNFWSISPPFCQKIIATPIKAPPAITPDATGKVNSSALAGDFFWNQYAMTAPMKNSTP